MKLDSKGQISLEYLMIFAVSLIILIVFTIPIAEVALENTLDVHNSLKIKSDISKISDAINQVYSEGQGSKQSVHIVSDKAFKLNINKNSLNLNLKLNDNSAKLIKTNHNSNLKSTSLYISKGDNIIVVSWPVGDKNMVVFKE